LSILIKQAKHIRRNPYISKDLDMLYKRIIKNKKVAKRIIERVKRNRIVISELNLLKDIYKLVKENFKHIKNQVRILVK
jgi:hypothetical protein